MTTKTILLSIFMGIALLAMNTFIVLHAPHPVIGITSSVLAVIYVVYALIESWYETYVLKPV